MAGLGFASRTGPSGAGLGALTQYAIGGAIWYVITAIMLAFQVGLRQSQPEIDRWSPPSPVGAAPPPNTETAASRDRAPRCRRSRSGPAASICSRERRAQ